MAFSFFSSPKYIFLLENSLFEPSNLSKNNTLVGKVYQATLEININAKIMTPDIGTFMRCAGCAIAKKKVNV